MGSSIVHLCIYGIVSVILLCQLTSAVPPHQCQPGLIDELPLKLRKICAALYTLADFTDAGAAQQYLNEKANLEHQLDLGNIGGIKRQDDGLDHMFMRFGRG